MVRVRVFPKAARPGIAGVDLDAEGRAYLKVRLGAPPEGGKANRELVLLLAKAWKVAPGRIGLVAGFKSRRKVVSLSGEPERLMALLTGWMKERDV